MSFRLIPVALAIVAMSSSTWSAQTATAPGSRAEVKAETRAAERAGHLTPAGEGRPTDGTSNFKSSKTRAERKSETLQARKNKELVPTGNAAQQKLDVALRAQKPTRTRAERKAETRQDIAQGQLVPAGEGPQAPRK
jgi:hypothetical protein